MKSTGQNNIFGLNKSDTSLYKKFFVFGFFLAASHALFEINAISQFIVNKSGEELANAFLTAVLIGFGISVFVSIAQNWFAYGKIGITLYLAYFIYLSLLLYFNYTSPKLVTNLGFYGIIPSTYVVLRIFWGSFERAYNLRQVRRLNSKIDLGFYIGSIVALLGAYFLVRNEFDLQYLYLASTAFAFVALFIYVTIVANAEGLNEIQESAQLIISTNKYVHIFKKKYLRNLALIIVCTSFAFIFIEFSYFHVLKDYAKSTMDVFSKISLLFGVTLAVSLPIQFFLLGYIIEKYSLKISSLFLPIFLSCFLILLVVVDSIYGYDTESDSFLLIFLIITICKLLYFSLHKSMALPSFKMYFFPIKDLLRFNTSSKFLGPVKFLSLIGAVFLIRLFVSFHESGFIDITYILAGVVFLWVIASIKIHKEYREVLKDTLESQQELVNTGAKFSKSIEENLLEQIPEVTIHEIAYKLSILRILNPLLYKSGVLSILKSMNERIQAIALKEASLMCILEAIPVLEEFMQSKYYQASANQDLIIDTVNKLKNAEFRLQRIKYIEQLTLSKITTERVFGARLSSYADTNAKPKLLNKLYMDERSNVRLQAVASSANADNADIYNNVIQKLGEEEYGNTAIAAIVATGEKMIPTLDSAFYVTGQTEKTQIRIVQALGRIGNEQAVSALLTKLKYKNQNVSTYVLKELSRTGFNVKGNETSKIKQELEEISEVLTWNIASYLDLKEQKADKLIVNAISSEIEENYNSIYQLLALLYDPKSIELVKIGIRSENVNEVEFSTELLDVILNEDIKTFIIPLLNSTPYEEKVIKMKDFFPTTNVELRELLFDIVQRDYSYLNRWTKACALQLLSQTDDADDELKELFLANLVNPDQMIRETAARALYKHEPKKTFNYINRFKGKLSSIEEQMIISPEKLLNKEVDGEAPQLQFGIVAFLQSLPQFSHIRGVVLLDIAKNLELINYKEGEIITSNNQLEDMDYYFLYKGSCTLEVNNQHLSTFDKPSIISWYNYLYYANDFVILKANSSLQIYRMRQSKLNELISYFDEIPLSMLASESSLISHEHENV